MIRILLALFLLLIAAPATAQVNLAQETARLEDLTSVRQIKHLQAHWGHLQLRGSWQAMAALLTGDATVTFQHGVMEGRAAILADLIEQQGLGHDGLLPDRLNVHLWFSPVIVLDGDGQGATGRWQELALTGSAGQSSDWTGGVWVVRYVQVGGEWRISAMRYYLQFEGPYSEGWRHNAATLERAPDVASPAQAGRLLPTRAAAVPLPQAQIDAEASLLLEHGRVQNLVNAFGYYLDRGLYDDAVDLTFGDVRVTVQGEGSWLGQESFRRWLGRIGAPGLTAGELNDRPQLMPKVILSRDGRLASVSAVELGMTGQHGAEGYWSVTLNHFVLMRDDAGSWRISSLYRIPIMRSTYRAGWGTPLAAVQMQSNDGTQADTPHPQRPMAYPQASVTQPISDLGIFAPALVRDAAPPMIPDALTRAEAFDAGENITGAYGAYINRFAWEEMAALFAEDGWRELPFIGAIAGRDRILAAAHGRYAGGSTPSNAFQAIHSLAQPYVTVLGPAEPGAPWRMQLRARLVQTNSSASGPGSWLAGVYEWQLQRVADGRWLIAGMDLDYTWGAPYAVGWPGADGPAMAAALTPNAEQLARYQIDGPIRGAVGIPFPAVEVLGFHYANPVSGRPPERRVEWTDLVHRP